MNMDLHLPSSWKSYLAQEFLKDYMLQLQSFLQREIDKNKIIYPSRENIFKALELTSLEKTKVVILGQDPYHGEGQAHGLAFSVPDNIALPPSLKNILQELENDLGIQKSKSGNLTLWANEGVLLLNTVLTVENSKAGSHQKKGWEDFTNTIIQILNDRKKNLVFVLWGSAAQEKGKIINAEKHLVLKSVHPSPLSSYRGFFGSKPFSRANEYLKLHGINPVNWKLS